MTVLNPEEGIAVFTDGSSYNKDRSGGWAWVALDAEDGLLTDSGYVGDTTNNRMEMTALIKALDTLFIALGPLDLLVVSDSEYVVLGAQDKTRARNKNVDLWHQIDSAIGRHAYVEFEHMRGHSKDKDHPWNVFNEMADDLAGKARKKGNNDG